MQQDFNERGFFPFSFSLLEDLNYDCFLNKMFFYESLVPKLFPVKFGGYEAIFLAFNSNGFYSCRWGIG